MNKLRQIKTNWKWTIYNRWQMTRQQWDDRWQNDKAMKDFEWNMTNNKIWWILKMLWHDKHDRWWDKNCDEMIDDEW